MLPRSDGQKTFHSHRERKLAKRDGTGLCEYELLRGEVAKVGRDLLEANHQMRP